MKNILIFRFVAAYVDLLVGLAIASPFILLGIFTELHTNMLYMSLIISLAVAIFFCKDVFSPQSIGKKIFGLKIINKKDRQATKCKLTLIFRNFFIILWPIDLLFCIINPKRRLGDILAGTSTSIENRDSDNGICSDGRCYLLVLPVLLISWGVNYGTIYLISSFSPIFASLHP